MQRCNLQEGGPLQRLGAIHLEERIVLHQNCVVTRGDGNAVTLSGYNRNTAYPGMSLRG